MANLVDVEILGLEDVMKRLGNAASPKVLRAGMTKAVGIVKDAVMIYPPPSGRPMRFKSERQRRYVMMLVSQGKVPYQRTLRLQSSWKTSVEGSGEDIEGVVSNDTPYGPYVQGKKSQAKYHVGTWPPAIDVATEHKDEIIQCFLDVVQDGLGGK